MFVYFTWFLYGHYSKSRYSKHPLLFFQLVFVAVRGITYLSDIAIDDISVAVTTEGNVIVNNNQEYPIAIMDLWLLIEIMK